VRRHLDEEVKTTLSEMELIPDADDSILSWNFCTLAQKPRSSVYGHRHVEVKTTVPDMEIIPDADDSILSWKLILWKTKTVFFVIGLICLHILIMLCD
jgi:hypothetical protein